MQNGIAHNGLILLCLMKGESVYARGVSLCPITLFCTCRYPLLWVPAFLFTLCKEKLMKRHLNTSYRLVWNHITGTLVVASELARSRGKRTGVAVALSLAAVTSVPVLAADTVVQAGETVSGGTLTNHDNQIVFGTAIP
ncbi:ESPR domain-containing protein [Escherichia coli]|uniref:ESPR domain-containing protein n=4 Tax=Escherichia coli TaxID=562 RepID=UPI00296F03D5|nr:ESPR domain-containing protein [Escherichia coli]WOZ34148.1 ESPR domain-containing protein [Escherichia coli]